MRSIFLMLLCSLGLSCFQYAAAQDCKGLIETTPRGIQCLHCTHPRAENAAIALVEPLLGACLKNIALGFVLDASFGDNLSVISKMTKILSEKDRHVFLHFYLINGPAQRRYADDIFPSSIFQINPFEFRRKISSNTKFQNDYTNFVSGFSELFLSLQTLGASISISPMLEDNLDDASFNQIIDQTISILPADLSVSLVRSPCRDCFSGNGSEIPPGVAREEHRGDISFRFSNGIISNDGWGYVKFPGDNVTNISRPVSHKDKRIEKIMSLDQLKPVLKKASSQNNIFLLWLSKYQATLPGNRSLNINKRKYPMPRKSELRLIQKFLS